MINSLFGSGPAQEPNLLERLKAGIQKTRAGFVGKVEELVSGKKQIDADLLDELEYTLISADIGVATATEILERIRQRVDRKLVGDASELKGPDSRASARNSAGCRTSRSNGGEPAGGRHGRRCERGGENHDHR